MDVKMKLNGYEVRLDVETYRLYKHEIVGVYQFYKGKYYVVCRDGEYLHRKIMGLCKDDSVYVDHINGNTLDNRKCNLRLCSNAQNQWNVGKKATSKQTYKGVRKTKSNTYEARIRANGKRLHLGTFKTEKEAVEVYNAKARELHGEFAFINNYVH